MSKKTDSNTELNVSSFELRPKDDGAQAIWVKGKQGSWETQQCIGILYKVGELFVIQNNFTGKPVAVITSAEDVYAWLKRVMKCQF